MVWNERAAKVIDEAILCHKDGRLRSALHAAYDAVSLVCESQNPPSRGMFSYQVSINRPRGLTHPLGPVLAALSSVRERMAHYPYRTPEAQEVHRLIAGSA